MTISIEEAQNLLLNAISKKPKEEELLLENALGRILSRDIISQMQVPPFYRSSMDGYALLSSATVSSSEENPRSFQVLQEIGAGSMADYPIDEKTTIKIMTGAAIPENADCVIRFEDIIRQGQEIILKMPVKKGQNIIPAGEDIAQNQKTASQGDILSPPLLGILASLGQKSVYVYQKPQIAIISTGSELWDIGQPLPPAKIYNSNAYCLAGYCQQLGAQTIISTIAKDTIEAICQSLEDALAKADLLITTGGVSVGDYDLVAECLQTIGADFLYEGVGMKPGKPSLAGIKDDKIILSLSGNPAAAMTAFLMLGQPLIKKMTGLTNIQHLKIKALMMDDFPKKSIQRRFLRGQVKIEDNQAKVYLTGSQRNSVLMSMVDCNALIDIPAGNQGIEKGCLLDVYLTDNL